LGKGELDARTEFAGVLETTLSGDNKPFQILFSTENKGDLLVLFHRNPGLIDTFDGVARRIGRTAKAIEGDVRDLVTIGILRTRKIGAHEVITFDASKDDEIQEVIVSHLNGINVGKATQS
jgi:hypothetical protein